MNKLNPIPAEETSAQNNEIGKSASRFAIITLTATILTAPLAFFLAWQLNSWQIYTLVVVIFAVAAIQFFALQRIRQGTYEHGGWLLIIGQFIAMLAGAALFAGVGLTLGFIAVILTYIISSQSMSAKSARKAILVGIGAGLLFIAVDRIHLDYRLSVPGLEVYGPVISGLIITAVGFFIAQQAWQRSIRNKLIVAFVGVSLLATGTLTAYIYFSTTRLLQESLELQFTEHASEAANGIGALIDEQIDLMNALALSELLQQTAQEINQTYQGSTSTIRSTLDLRDAEWRAAAAANNDSDPLVREYLTNPAALALKEFKEQFPGHAEVFITDIYGGQAGATNRTSDYYQADEEWWQAAYNNGQGAVYVSEPEYDESAGALAVLIAVPLRDQQTGKMIGILRTTFLASNLNDLLGESLGQTGVTALLIPGETASYFSGDEFKQLEPGIYKQLQVNAGQGMVQMDFEGVPSVMLQVPISSLEEDSLVNGMNWVVIFHQSRDEAFEPINAQLRGTFLVMTLVVAMAVAIALVVSLYLVRPIAELTQTAEEVASGNLKRRAKITSKDEVGILASTFNSMTSQLQETLQGLEQRVTARTRDLAIVAEVGTATATILESKRLLQEVVDLTKERFHLYHSHIYLLDEKGENLVLTAGAGEPGRVMVAEGRSIPLDREQSLVARAARERKGVTVNDVMQAPDFLPNPLLPETRSELAVPMIVGGQVIGVFDIQSEQVGRFTESDVNIQTTLAAQLATSIQNVRSYEQSRRQAELEALINSIGQKIQRTTSIEDTLQTAIRELGTAIGASRVQAQISRSNGEN